MKTQKLLSIAITCCLSLEKYPNPKGVSLTKFERK
jgi:hypothetical protein